MKNRTRLAAVAAALSLGSLVAVPSSGATTLPHYPRGHAKACRAGYHGETWRKDPILRVRVKVKGHVVWRREHRIVRYVECVAYPVKPKPPAPPAPPVTPPTHVTTTTTPTPTTTTLPTPPVVVTPPSFTGGGGGGGSGGGGGTTTVVRASVDPSYTIAVATPQPPPLPVTFDYSASVASGTLPAGTLTLNIYVHGSVSSAGGCAANVGPSLTSTACTVTIPAWGKYDLVTNYSGGGTVAASTATETVDVEPPALPPLSTTQSWTPSSASITILSPTSGTLSVSSSNFEGATSLTLADQLGDSCAATVSGTTASCTTTLTGAPTSLVVGYPGGTTTVTTETASPWGVAESQQLTTTWPAEPALSTAASVTRASQTVTFSSSGLTIENGSTYTPSASATSGGPVTFSASGACTASNGVVTADVTGTDHTCVVTATQGGTTYYAPASAEQSFTVYTVTTTTDPITQIDAFPAFFNGAAPSPCNPGAYQCLAMGVEGLPAQGTVTLTVASDAGNDGAQGESCTVSLATANVCFVRDSLTTQDLTAWTIKAVWSGYSTTDSAGNVTNYVAPSVAFSMVKSGAQPGDPSSVTETGTWFTYDGTPTT